MSDLDAATPRVFLAQMLTKRCNITGETEWTKTGQYTGKSDLELTAAGIRQVTGTAAQLVGPGKLIDPTANVLHIFVSPRKRAQQTYDCLFDKSGPLAECTTVTEDIAEWSYGDYEGLRTAEIKALRSERGLDQEKPWDIWRDGCEGGE
ncbi:hypothetical protein G7054_g13933 [Neopestalotiopsis clavispora]|nr:hypothetical protein G7054_g13933 [Neopestalotiopsis clavispora]